MRCSKQITSRLNASEICNTFLSVVGFLEMLAFFICRCSKFVAITEIASKYIEMFFLRQNFLVPRKRFLKI